MNPYQALANAIIERAALDYRDALKELHRNPHYKEAQKVKDDCESFFLSNWFGVLTNLDGKVLMEDIRRMVRAEAAV